MIASFAPMSARVVSSKYRGNPTIFLSQVRFGIIPSFLVHFFFGCLGAIEALIRSILSLCPGSPFFGFIFVFGRAHHTS